MTTKTIELGEGISVTLSSADGWSIMKRQAVSERLAAFADGSPTLDNYLWYYAMCAAQVTAVSGLEWQPCDVWVSVEDLKANFEAWLKALPDPTANITFWLNTIAALNNPAVENELAPGGNPDPDEAGAEKKDKSESPRKKKPGAT